MSMHNAVTIELITSSKGQKKDLIILSSPHVYKTRKQKITVTSNPVMTIYGSGACPTMKKIIDVTVTTNRRNFTKHFRVQQKGRRLTTGRGVSILPTDPTVTPLFQAFSINGSFQDSRHQLNWAAAAAAAVARAAAARGGSGVGRSALPALSAPRRKGCIL